MSLNFELCKCITFFKLKQKFSMQVPSPPKKVKHKLNLIAMYVADKALESTTHKTLIQISKEKTLPTGPRKEYV